MNKKPHEQEWAVYRFDNRCVVDRIEDVITDIRVPGGDGADVARLIAAAPEMARSLLRRLSHDAAPCLCHLTTPETCDNCEDRALLRKAGVP